MTDDEVIAAIGIGGELGALRLVNNWNIVAARGMSAGKTARVYTVVS